MDLCGTKVGSTGHACSVCQSYLTLCDPMHCSQSGSSVHGISQARILKWVSIPFYRASSQPMDWTQVSRNAGRFFTAWITRDAQDRAQTHLIKCQIQSLSCPILTQSLRSNSSLVAQLVKDPPAIQGTLVRLLGRKIPWRGIGYPLQYSWVSLVVQMVRNLPAMWETWVDSWVGKIPWRRAWQPTPVFLPGELPWTEDPGGLQSLGSQRVRHNWVTKHSTEAIKHGAPPLETRCYLRCSAYSSYTLPT